MSLSPAISRLSQAKHVGYGLPCAHCLAYYPADLSACPICGCRERVPANGEDVHPPLQLTARQTVGGA